MAMAIGALLLGVADTVGRTAVAPIEIPSGLVVSLGCPTSRSCCPLGAPRARAPHPRGGRRTSVGGGADRRPDLRDGPLDRLSGGQRQRAWIAMALAQDTPILLLDEPTTYLDLAHQLEVLDLLADLNHACRYAYHLVALREGVVHAAGAPEAIVDEELLHAVFGLRSRVLPDPVTGTPMCVPIGRTVSRSVA